VQAAIGGLRAIPAVVREKRSARERVEEKERGLEALVAKEKEKE